MALEFDREGINVDTQADIYNRIADGFRDIYGADINLDQNSPDGQRVGIFAKEILDIESFASLLYSQLDIDTTFGTFLDVLLKITGIARMPASRSSATLTITSDRNTTLPVNYTVADTTGQQWVTTVENTLVVGDNTVSVVAEEFGAKEAAPGTITEAVTIVLGVTNITNPAAAVLGLDEETDEAVRIRRNRSLENAAYSTLGGAVAKLLELNGVTGLAAYENDTSVQDTVRDIAPHTIWFVIAGGENAEIAEVLAKNKTGGTGIKGDTEVVYTETIIRPDATSIVINHQLRFDRPTTTPLHVRMNARRRDATQPIDDDLIKRKLSENEFDIAENATATELYAPAYTAGTNFILSDLEISLDGSTYTDESLFPGYASQFTIAIADVDITEL